MPFEFPNRQIPTMRPGKAGFDSERSRGVGGKTMLWNAVALRFSQRDFKGRHDDGAGEDWPIDYADIAPYYDAIEREVGVCGNLDHLEDLPDGIFLPPVPDEMQRPDHASAARAKLGANVIHVRKATLTVATPPGRPAISAATAWRAATWWRSTTRPTCTSRPAEKTGQRDGLPDCIVREVLVSEENRATGVRYLDRVHKQRRRGARAPVVVACACVQSVALLLMSKSRRYPDRTGQFQRRSSGGTSSRISPAGSSACSRTCAASRRPTTKASSITPTSRRSCTTASGTTRAALARSSTIRTGGSVGWARTIAGFGQGLQAAVKAPYPAYRHFSPYGEMLPNASLRGSRLRADR